MPRDLKLWLALSLVALAGCTTTPTTSEFDKSDMASFVPDCGRAKTQVEYLQSRIITFHEYFKNRQPSLEDRKYYTRLKNNLWSLRSSCSVLQQ